LPPLLPSLASQLEEYLLHPELLPLHDTPPAVRFPKRKPDPLALLHVRPAPRDLVLKVVRDPATGEVQDFVERRVKGAGTTARNSSSLQRAPGPPEETTRGSASNFPFWPGGFEELPPLPTLNRGNEVPELDFSPENLLHCPPGFERGIDFYALSQQKKTQEEEVEDVPINLETAAVLSQKEELVEEPKTVLNLATELLGSDRLILDIFKDGEKDVAKEETKVKTGLTLGSLEGLDDDFASLDLDSGGSVLSISTAGASAANAGPRVTEWAERLDAEGTIPDFHQQVPQMAFQFPFELDTFQKQAVLKLEQAESVFVAAHTSAGKTVVAEYAIALSQKHMTRTIYTSPIKALSNQKFRDFKDTFNDVGLVTGDIQINPAATCLIMTTEILRSMLYNGSDIIRDLEWVVFDEVHYINDPERGVVWEEVLILLPDHVNIIMLSATVPNTMEFADWVGRTKKKKIWVISTPKRPVPLEHFLYTGSSGKTRDERFLLQDAGGSFLQSGHAKAVQAKKERESKGKQGYGSKGTQDRVGPQQEKGIWLTLIDHLARMDKLPVVAFTLSRNRCDQTANSLTSLDLTSAMEKSDIHYFISKCVQRLKPPDRRLPQVVTLTELLKRGIGIHHSGILPILKEVVECCFAKGWVKLLFATETFAMGVNMPARTVVFDNIRKHDGKQFRTLLPAEYIQMAGRAGRRGLDSTGTVIILCKGEVWEMSELHGMMQGKPTRLESKFRITYSMILNLLRVEQLRVEDMMKRSFAELSTQKKVTAHKERAVELRAQLETLPDISGSQFTQIEEFYTAANQWLNLRGELWSLLLSHPVPMKALQPGRLLICTWGAWRNVLCALLACDTRGKQRTFSVLVLKQEEESHHLELGEKDSKSERKDLFLSLACPALSNPSLVSCSASVAYLQDKNVISITNKTIKLEAEKILADVKKREIPRFRGDPPGQSVAMATQHLLKAQAGDSLPEVLDPLRDFRVQDMEILGMLQKMETLKNSYTTIQPLASEQPDFRANFEVVFSVMAVKEELEMCEYLASEASLTLLPEYHCRVGVLRALQYVDSSSVVQLKGRVGCEMGSNELIITELVFENKLTERPPEEIAALLSCMVFQQRNCSEPELTDSLKKGVEEIRETAARVGQVQVEQGLAMPVGDYVDSFNFGLVEVVYEWARGMPFSEITGLTDVQEGVIVRTIQRLDETLRDVKDAARVIGDPMLYQKMDQASAIIKRDIVFAASLYTE